MLLDALFLNGRFTTLDPRRPHARSLGVLGGVVVGFDDELAGCTARATYDLGGAPVVPGFNDAHHHLRARGQDLVKVDTSPAAVRSLDELYRAIAHKAATLPPDAWVLATGYDDSKLDAPPTRLGLDEAAGGRPVWLVHCSHHSGVVSTEAIRQMGYTDPRDLPYIDTGFVERLPDGTPTGFLAEKATELVARLLRPSPVEDYIQAIGLGSEACLADGITSVTEPGISGTLTGNGATDLGAFQSARRRGLLDVRMTLMPEMSALHELGSNGDSAFGLDLGLRTGFGDDHLRIGAVKMFSDGALTARTAAMTEDYADRVLWRGFLQHDPEVLRERVLAAHAHGWQVAVHAIGDAAVDAVLDAYEHAQRTAPRPDARHRIEHWAWPPTRRSRASRGSESFPCRRRASSPSSATSTCRRSASAAAPCSTAAAASSTPASSCPAAPTARWSTARRCAASRRSSRARSRAAARSTRPRRSPPPRRCAPTRWAAPTPSARSTARAPWRPASWPTSPSSATTRSRSPRRASASSK
jgi:predicted amidohydrolase YtcJ